MLDYDLSARGDAPLYEFLYRSIRDDVAAGRLAAGDRLPSKRALAEHLGVSVVTVEGAYEQLVVEGYVASRPRSGFYVCELPAAAHTMAGAGMAGAGMAGAPAAAGATAPVAPMTHGASRQEDGMRVGDAAPRVATGRMGGSATEAGRLWMRALRATLAEEPDASLFAASPAQGLPRLREAIARYLRQTRGMEVDPECVVVGAGAQVLDGAIVQLLGRHGLSVALEDPGYPRLTSLYRAHGARVEHIPLDAQGMRCDLLERSGANVVHLMPSHQYPTGLVTSIARRYELLGWASRADTDRWIVEDDYDCEFRLAGRPVPSLASVDACGRVIYSNTFSMGLGSALRLAYMVLPPQLAQRYVGELGFYSSTVGTIDQLALARILADGSYERHVARVRKRARDERDALRRALEASGASGRVRMEAADAGLHCVLAVDARRSESELAALLGSRGIEARPMGELAYDARNATAADGLRRLVVRYDSVDEPRATEALRALARR